MTPNIYRIHLVGRYFYTAASRSGQSEVGIKKQNKKKRPNPASHTGLARSAGPTAPRDPPSPAWPGPRKGQAPLGLGGAGTGRARPPLPPTATADAHRHTATGTGTAAGVGARPAAGQCPRTRRPPGPPPTPRRRPPAKMASLRPQPLAAVLDTGRPGAAGRLKERRSRARRSLEAGPLPQSGVRRGQTGLSRGGWAVQCRAGLNTAGPWGFKT